MELNSSLILFYIFIIQALLFIVLLLHFLYVAKGSKREAIRAKMFLHVDPIIKSFYLFLFGIILSYLFFLIYFIDNAYYGLFIIGELALGLSIIGFVSIIISLFIRQSQ
ncbi:MAG: hypothetical protein DRO76_04465 [Candidatus Altiarchaeales archaeon]|nr:MAG: hypothetical protein DRO76_04465 [Candidatus Altiarchaeales archaeon]